MLQVVITHSERLPKAAQEAWPYLPKSYAIAAGTFLFFPVNAWNATLGSEMRIVL